jgi:hypothetical protein
MRPPARIGQLEALLDHEFKPNGRESIAAEFLPVHDFAILRGDRWAGDDLDLSLEHPVHDDPGGWTFWPDARRYDNIGVEDD